MGKRLTNNLNISIFAALKVSEVSKIPVLLLSNPGIGKTTTVYMFAKQRGYEVVELRGNSTTAEEVNGYDVSPKDVTFERPVAACHLRPSWFEEVQKNSEKGLKTLLFLDEITTANEFVQAALLKLIFDRTCGREPLPENTLIVSAGNYSSNLTSSMSLLPPVMNRFMIYNIIPTQGDLEVFLNRYKGAAIGRLENYQESVAAVLKEMDERQKIVPESVYNKIGELFENAILITSKQIMQGETKVDMAITDLQDIYNTLSSDPRVYGFISFRTLTYLRDVAIAWYLCFGKEGINSENFRMAIDGLCGVGLKYARQVNQNRRGGQDEDVEVTTVHVGEFFHNSLRTAANDCEKLGNALFEEYADYFRDWLEGSKKWKGNTNYVIVPEVNAAVNKIGELNKIPELQSIERPVEENVLREIMITVAESIKKKAEEMKVTTVTKIDRSKAENKDGNSAVPSDKVMGVINEINTVVDLFTSISSLIKDKDRGYSENLIQTYNQITTSDFTSTINQLKVIIKLLAKRDPELQAMIPQLKSLKS